MSLSSDEVNLLVYRYLQESGFRHSAFTFGHESLLARTPAVESDVPYGSLVGLLQKGLQFLEIERHVREDGTEAPHDHMTRPFEDAKARVTANETDKVTLVSAETAVMLAGHKGEALCCGFSPSGKTLASGGTDGTMRLWGVPGASDAGPVAVKLPVPGNSSSAGPAKTSSSSSASSGAQPEPAAGRAAAEAGSSNEASVIAWSNSGEWLACGGGLGGVVVVHSNGSARAELSEHAGTVLGLAFSPSDSYLASCGLDGRVSVTECEAFTSMPPISTHRAPVLDLAWQSDSVLATASADRTVQIHKVGTERAPRVFAGHSADVNCVEWDPTRTLLASCSDDASVRLWSAREGGIFEFKGHTAGVHAIEWAPGGGGGGGAGGSGSSSAAAVGGCASPSALLASAGADATVRLWDVNAAVCRATLRGHSGLVATARFSPDGLLMASGSIDRRVVVWSVADGKPVRTFEGAGGVLALDWHPSGGQLAVAFSDGSVAKLDLRE
ncbi:hypothetical protein FNF31_07107 [Cafeteria roenbergensis]|uniref:LisH domain-containing protein n=1 Tax=Cafeteria roenbergensis TaxID=33653 RepID=A0A5A8CDY5_CAFRO|nr:hypothetical protein FNF31_07107 [Cafeteria roenbergensis]